MDREANATGFQVSNFWSSTAHKPYADASAESLLELKGHTALV